MIAVCIGHSRGDGGAASVDGTSEWSYNQKIGKLVVADLRERGFAAMLVDTYAQAGYGRAMQFLAAMLKREDVELAVELHFNSADNPKATGHEWLHWHASGMGRKLAQCLDRRMCETFPEHRRRGLVLISGDERGAGFLRQLHCPAVICEPFFGSNATDWKLATAHSELLARVTGGGIDDWKGGADE